MGIQDVMDALNVTRATVYRFMNDGRLPTPMYLAPRRPRWRVEEIEAAVQRLDTRENANA